nr:hypothetical protein [uncultured Vibrio sp.]
MSSFPDLLTAFEEAVEVLKVKLSQDSSKTTSYNGEIIQSIAKDIDDRWSAIQAMVQGRVVFATKADMDADLNHAENTLAEVWNDSDQTKNGLYGKVGFAGAGSWIKSSGDIANQALEVANSAQDKAVKNTADMNDVKGALETTQGKNELITLTDSVGNIVALVTNDGSLILPNLNNSVQDEINSIKESTVATSTSPADFITASIDAVGNIVRKVNNRGDEIHRNMTPVLSDINPIEISERGSFSESAERLLTRLAYKKSIIPPPFFHSLPNGFGIPDSFINAFSVDIPENYSPLDTCYHKDDDVVHPYVCEVPTNFLGYKYLMAQTPYHNSSQENPILFGSTDSLNWEMIEECPMPIYPSPLLDEHPHMSDNCLSYDPINGRLYVIWRRTVEASVQYDWMYRYTENGIVWSDAGVIEPPSININLSPSFMFNPNDGLWHCFYARDQSRLTHATSKDISGPYSDIGEWTNSGIWHLEVKFMGEKYVALINYRESGQINFAVSDDGNTWVLGSPLIPGGFTGLYKCSFLPMFRDNKLKFRIYMATNLIPEHPFHHKFLINDTNEIDLGTL